MTGLVYVAIVALWAAVLIPMWLRRHDDDQARRIERHRVAMGTLARFAGPHDVAPDAAARRRRVVLAATATLGAVASGAWIAGLAPGSMVALGWMPLVGYLPAALVAERRSARQAAELALQRRRARHGRRASTHDIAVAQADTSGADESRNVPARFPAPTSSQAPLAWDDVFDQTA